MDGESTQERRFGFGQAAGILGATAVAGSVTQPWLRLDLSKAFATALRGDGVSAARANEILFVGSNLPAREPARTAAIDGLADRLGLATTGWEQQQYVAIALLVLAGVALIATVRSLFARTAWEARALAPWLTVAGFGALAAAAATLWLLAPAPRAGMEPDVGLWILVGGAIGLLLGALTLGNNRRRPFVDDDLPPASSRAMEGGEHLVYAHGAWVPRDADTSRPS